MGKVKFQAGITGWNAVLARKHSIPTRCRLQFPGIPPTSQDALDP
jgi:hypothetical protein